MGVIVQNKYCGIKSFPKTYDNESTFYATNKLGREVNGSEKVLVNLRNQFKTIIGNKTGNQTYKGVFIPASDNTIMFTNAYSNLVTFHTLNPDGGYSEVKRISVSLEEMPRDFSLWSYAPNKYIWKVLNSDTDNQYFDLNSKTVFFSDDFPIKDNLVYSRGNWTIYNRETNESYTTPINTNSRNSYDIFLTFGNYFVVGTTGKLMIVDLTNFPNCESKIINFPKIYQTLIGITGYENGDYVIVQESTGTCCFLKFNGESFKVDFTLEVMFSYPRFDNTTGLFVGFDTQFNLKGYIFNKTQKLWTAFDFPQEVRKYFKEDCSTSGFKTMAFFTNPSLDMYSWMGHFGGYINWARVIQIVDKEENTYIYENNNINYNPISSFTGITTGITDEEGKIQVKATLPEILSTSITVTPDPDSLEILGGTN